MREVSIVVREFDAERDRAGAVAVERSCEVVSSGKMSLLVDPLGDPLCRVRHSPAFLMLLAETAEPVKEIVGLIRGCIKTASCGMTTPRDGGSGGAAKHHRPVYTKLAYILGLRVSPSYRRMGIGLKLVQRMEEWFKAKGAEYAYMATEKDNEASVRLFTRRCGYSKFRTPSVLVHPVFAHLLPLPRRVSLLRLPPHDAELLYRHRFSATEFFPRDIDAVLCNPLSLGTFLAVYSDPEGKTLPWAGAEAFLADPPESWAVVSVWNCKDVFRLEVRGVSSLSRTLAKASRVVDRALPWLGIPSMPNVFRPFGLYFLFGLGGEGPCAAGLVRALCRHAHNMARDAGCGVVATEVAACEPLRAGVPHWRIMSCAEDLWCVKRLAEDYSDGDLGDWTKAPPGPSIFVDPREV